MSIKMDSGHLWPVQRGGRAFGGAQAPPPQFLADQLTLSQPGGHILPTQYYDPPPRIFRPCNGPALVNGFMAGAPNT